MTTTNPNHDLLSIEVAQSKKYAGSDWCAEMFDRFDNLSLGSGIKSDPRIRKSDITGRGWMSMADAGAVGFFREMAENPELQARVDRIESVEELVKLAEIEGYRVSPDSLVAIAKSAYDKWRSGMTQTVVDFFEAAAKNKDMKGALTEARGPGEIIAVAKKFGFELTESELEPMHLKLNDLHEPEAQEIYGAMLALRILRNGQ